MHTHTYSTQVKLSVTVCVCVLSNILGTTVAPFAAALLAETEVIVHRSLHTYIHLSRIRLERSWTDTHTALTQLYRQSTPDHNAPDT